MPYKHRGAGSRSTKLQASLKGRAMPGWLQAHSMVESTGEETALQSGQSQFMTKSRVRILTSMQSKLDPRDSIAWKSIDLHLPPKVEPTRW